MPYLLRTSLSLLLVCATVGGWTAGAATTANGYRYEFDQACVEAYRAIIELRINEGRDRLRELRRTDPSNLVPVWLEDYADFFEVYISEDASTFERLDKAYRERLKLLEQGPTDSPYHRYARANCMLHWALARLKFGEYVTTFREARKAYKLLEATTREFPDFVLARKELGVLRAAVATVPSGYQWGVEFITGMDGDLAGGKQLIESVLEEQRQTSSPFLQETTAIYAFLLLNLERDEDEAWARIRGADFDEQKSLLGAFVQANIAMRTGRNDEAIRLLTARPYSPRYYPFPYLDFMLGVCLQRKLDASATVYLRSFIDRKRSGNFIKEAYQKLAWQAALSGKQEDYYLQLKRIEEFGTDVVGSDRNALREAELRVMPNPNLLRARLLYDGGYFDRARGAIESVDHAILRGEQTIELPYRAARIYAAQGELDEAARLYKQAISLGRDSPAYFACKSAVELGVLAERAGESASAEAYFELALDLEPSEYAAGLHQQAKAGLARLDR